jgi:hypothetical protein
LSLTYTRCALTTLAIARDKRELSTPIAALQRMQTQPVEFETPLKRSSGHCSSMSKVAIGGSNRL